MKYGQNIFIEDDILFQLAKNSGKIVMHIKAVGAIECNDEEKEQEVWDFYYDKCDLNVLNILMQFKEAYCYFDTPDQAINAYDEWFPSKKLLLDEESHLFVKVTLMSPDGSLAAENE
jgi:hypothetical protein